MIRSAWILLGAVALAQTPEAEAPGGDAGGGAEPPTDERCKALDPTTAEVNSREAVRLAKEGRFAEAVPLFRIAVRLDPCAPDHRLLLARALARTGDRDGARHGYATVIERFPGTPASKRARTELDELEATPPPPDKLEPMPPADPGEPGDLKAKAEPAPAGTPWRPIGYGTAGVGLALVGIGVYFALDAQDAQAQLEDRPGDRARYDELVDQRDGSTTLSYVFYGLGAAAVAGGAVMVFVLHEDAPPVSLAPAPGGGTLTWKF